MCSACASYGSIAAAESQAFDFLGSIWKVNSATWARFVSKKPSLLPKPDQRTLRIGVE